LPAHESPWHTGSQIWTASFVEAADDVFKLQDRLAV